MGAHQNGLGAAKSGLLQFSDGGAEPKDVISPAAVQGIPQVFHFVARVLSVAGPFLTERRPYKRILARYPKGSVAPEDIGVTIADVAHPCPVPADEHRREGGPCPLSGNCLPDGVLRICEYLRESRLGIHRYRAPRRLAEQPADVGLGGRQSGPGRDHT
jgi:hypothetical protein